MEGVHSWRDSASAPIVLAISWAVPVWDAYKMMRSLCWMVKEDFLAARWALNLARMAAPPTDFSAAGDVDDGLSGLEGGGGAGAGGGIRVGFSFASTSCGGGGAT